MFYCYLGQNESELLASQSTIHAEINQRIRCNVLLYFLSTKFREFTRDEGMEMLAFCKSAQRDLHLGFGGSAGPFCNDTTKNWERPLVLYTFSHSEFISRFTFTLSPKTKSLLFVIFRASGNVEGLLKPLLLTMDPPNLDSGATNIPKSHQGNIRNSFCDIQFVGKSQQGASGKFEKDTCQQMIEICLVTS